MPFSETVPLEVRLANVTVASESCTVAGRSKDGAKNALFAPFDFVIEGGKTLTVFAFTFPAAPAL